MLHPQAGITSFIDELVSQGLRNAVLSPGSRVAPISIALERHSSLNIYMAKDERSAAFLACGISLGTNKPTLIACTSGTAVLNYLPAVAEAFYQQIPIIVLSADRPGYWIDQLDGQALKQGGIFSAFVSTEVKLPLRALSNDQLYTYRLSAQQVFNHAKAGSKPVHINAPLDEPLYQLPYPEIVEGKIEYPSRKGGSINGKIPQHILRLIKSKTKALIVIGQLRPDIGKRLVPHLELLAENGWLILTDPLSNCHFDYSLSQLDYCLSKVELEEPELIFQIGGPVLSKKLKLWLRSMQKSVIEISPDAKVHDPFIGLAAKWEVQPYTALETLSLIKTNDQYAERNREKYKKTIASFPELKPHSEVDMFRRVYTSLESGSNLFLGNSLPVRHLQYVSVRSDIQHFSNRGVCGIDGVSSTALGLCIGSGEKTILITGDISFVHDTNSMWNDFWPDNFKIIVMNNGGGNIFRFIDGPQKTKSFEKTFYTPNEVNIKSMCEAFDKRHIVLDHQSDIKKLLSPESSYQVLEIKVNAIESDKELKRILK